MSQLTYSNGKYSQIYTYSELNHKIEPLAYVIIDTLGYI